MFRLALTKSPASIPCCRLLLRRAGLTATAPSSSRLWVFAAPALTSSSPTSPKTRRSYLPDAPFRWVPQISAAAGRAGNPQTPPSQPSKLRLYELQQIRIHLVLQG